MVLLTMCPECDRRGWSSCTRPSATGALVRTIASCRAARRRSSCASSVRRRLPPTISSGNDAISGEDGWMRIRHQNTLFWHCQENTRAAAQLESTFLLHSKRNRFLVLRRRSGRSGVARSMWSNLWRGGSSDGESQVLCWCCSTVCCFRVPTLDGLCDAQALMYTLIGCLRSVQSPERPAAGSRQSDAQPSPGGGHGLSIEIPPDSDAMPEPEPTPVSGLQRQVRAAAILNAS